MNNKEVFWNCDNELIRDFFKDFIKENYPNFKFKYNWENYSQIQDYLSRLMLNSYSSNSSVRSQLPILIYDVETFLATAMNIGLFNRSNIGGILKNLKEQFHRIEFLPDYSGNYGCSVDDIVQVNRNMTVHPNSPQLTSDEIRRLYIFHELGHKVLNVYPRDFQIITDYTYTINEVLRAKNGNSNVNLNPILISDGFLMLEECLTQELAEILTYTSSGKVRPSFRREYDLGCSIVTNFDYYGIFQMPTLNFGKTLRGCWDGRTSNKVLYNMIVKALNGNFAMEVISEYNQGNAQLYYDLALTLQNMGIIKCKKYHSFGGSNDYVGNCNLNESLKNIELLSEKNKDARSYPNNGYPIMDFNKYKSNINTIRRK